MPRGKLEAKIRVAVKLIVIGAVVVGDSRGLIQGCGIKLKGGQEGRQGARAHVSLNIIRGDVVRGISNEIRDITGASGAFFIPDVSIGTADDGLGAAPQPAIGAQMGVLIRLDVLIRAQHALAQRGVIIDGVLIPAWTAIPIEFRGRLGHSRIIVADAVVV